MLNKKVLLVSPEYLRFDFTHFSKLSQQQLKLIEEKVNNKIKENIPLTEHANLHYLISTDMGQLCYLEKSMMIQLELFNMIVLLNYGGTHVLSTSRNYFF